MHQLGIAAQSRGGRLRTCDPYAALHPSLLFFALLQYPGSLSPVSREAWQLYKVKIAVLSGLRVNFGYARRLDIRLWVAIIELSMHRRGAVTIELSHRHRSSDH